MGQATSEAVHVLLIQEVFPLRTIVTTAGTSLLTNAERAGKAKSLQTYLRFTEQEKASAETNSLSRLLQEGDRIVFLHSQTKEGERAATALATFYSNNGYPSDLREVYDLQYHENRFKMRGLRALVATLVDIIRQEREQGREVLINATGGFKAEIAYATLVGLLFDVPVISTKPLRRLSNCLRPPSAGTTA
ncbi:MAG: hypothetical protein C4335_05085 [Armatimonadota bacterium]